MIMVACCLFAFSHLTLCSGGDVLKNRFERFLLNSSIKLVSNSILPSSKNLYICIIVYQYAAAATATMYVNF